MNTVIPGYRKEVLDLHKEQVLKNRMYAINTLSLVWLLLACVNVGVGENNVYSGPVN